jgi:hypothetical protein
MLMTGVLMVAFFQNCSQKSSIVGNLSGTSSGSSQNCMGTAQLSWDPPTTNSDGSELTDLAGFRISYGTSPGQYQTVVDVPGSAANAFTLTLNAAGTYYFAMQAYNTAGAAGPYSTEVSKSYSQCGASLIIDLGEKRSLAASSLKNRNAQQ